MSELTRSSSLLIPFLLIPQLAFSSLTLTWQDNSDNEDGFRIERRDNAGLEFLEQALVGMDQTSFVDSTITEGSDYCYRVAAFNAAGDSAYTNEECAYGLSVALAGTGSGQVTASGIDCGDDCAETYPGDTSVSLTAVPFEGSLFSGWSGDSDCADGTVTMSSAKNCTATFELEPPPPPPPVTLAVNIIQTVTELGSGDGSVTSDPGGIDCGADCSESFAEGTVVTLTANPDATSVFTGWTGGGCSGTSACSLTLNGDTTVGAYFEPEAFVLTVSVIGPGTLTGPGIDCGEDCVESYRSGELVTLTAAGEEGGILESWSASACGSSATCDLTITGDMEVVVTFAEPPPPIPMVVGEVETDDTWARVDLDESFFSDPVVIAAAGFNDPAPGVVRTRNVDATGFDIRFQEWDYLDGWHGQEMINYIVAQRGSYTLDDGTRVEVNTIDTNAAKFFEAILFDQSFTQRPVVLATVATDNESDAVTPRIQNITTEGFELRLEEQQANKRKHRTETVSYIAWQPSSGFLGPIYFEVGTVAHGITHEWYPMTFDPPFETSPVFVAGMQTRNNGNTATIRWRNKEATGVKVKVEEEQSQNPETNHAAEEVGYFLLE